MIPANTEIVIQAIAGDVGLRTITFELGTPAPPILGDVNRDGNVDFLDISPFILLLSGQEFQAEADIDGSGSVDFLDISPFIGLLSNQ